MAEEIKLYFEEDMPPGHNTQTSGRSRGYRGQRSTNHKTHDGDGSIETDKRGRRRHERPTSTFRRAFRGNENSEKTPLVDEQKQDDILRHELSTSLEDYSRQRLRSLHMSLRQYSTDGSKVSGRDLTQALQENNIRIPGRVQQALTEKYEDSRGIDLERLYNFITDAHSKTGRDSVLAMHKRNDLSPKLDVTQDEIDEDLIWRVESLLVQSMSYINIETLRAAFQNRDTTKTGKIDSTVVRQICAEQQMPVFGALLKNLIKRCDDGNTGKVSWPEFISFLERSQQNAWVTAPELKELPEKLKSQTPVAPSPLDELSSRTRNTLVNKLRKKSSVKKPDLPDLVLPDDTSKQEIDHTQTGSQSDSRGVNIENESKENFQTGSNPEVTINSDDQDVTIDIIPPDVVIDDEESTDTKKTLRATSKIVRTSSGILSFMKGLITDKKESDTNDNIISPDKSEKPSDDKADENDTQKETATPTTDQEMPTNVNADVPEVTEDASFNHESSLRCENGSVYVTVRDKELKFPVPTGFQLTQTIDPPKERLKLLWVYGYRGNDCRKNIHVLLGGEIVYFMSYIAVIYNKETHRQRMYREHTDDIKCIDVHNNGLVVATGQFASRKHTDIEAHVRVWRSDTLHTLHILGMGEFERSVVCLAFSPGKEYLAAVDNSPEKKLTVWNTTTGERIGEALLGTDLVCDVGFNRRDPETLVTIGKEHICWWKVYEESRTIQNTAKPDYEVFLRAKFVICLTFTNRGDCITGDSNGTIYVWGDGGCRITNYVKHAHDGPVFTVLWNKGHVISGGRDGIVHCWQLNKNMDKSGFLQIPKLDGGVRMLKLLDQTLLIGTTMNSLLSATLAKNETSLNGATLDESPITQCHYDELRGLATIRNPTTTADIVTAGLDGIICTYNSSETRPVNKIQFKRTQYLCVDVSDDSNLYCLGTKDGHLQVIEKTEHNWELIVDQKLSKDRIGVIKFSPDCTMIAAGSQDTHIYMYVQQIKEDDSTAWEFLGKLKGHSGAVSGLDWSSERLVDSDTGPNNYILKSCSTTLEQRFWNPSTMEKTDEINIPSCTWATRTCTVDLSVAGILASKHVKGRDVQALDVSTSGSLVAMGDNGGNLSLFRYPCVSSGVFSHTYRGHASVHSVRFSQCGRYVFSVGGRDSCLMQWELV